MSTNAAITVPQTAQTSEVVVSALETRGSGPHTKGTGQIQPRTTKFTNEGSDTRVRILRISKLEKDLRSQAKHLDG